MNNIDILNKGLNELNISCSEEQVRSFLVYLSELKKWNRAYNLTALKTDEDIIIKHFLDSLLYIKVIPDGTLRLADAGSGAGFPGMAIKIARPEIELTLIEPSRKKASFLRHILRTLKLSSADVLQNRIEGLGNEYLGHFDIIASRATFGINEFLTMACLYVRRNGKLILNKGPGISEELKEGAAASAKSAVKEIFSLQLPFKQARRYLIVLSCKMKK